jgi:hypothetical protein
MRTTTNCQSAGQAIAWAVALGALAFFGQVARGEDDPWGYYRTEPAVALGQETAAVAAAPADFAPADFDSPVTADEVSTTRVSPYEEAVQKGEEDGKCCWNCNLCPCCYVVVEALILERNLQGSDSPLVVDTATGDTILSTDDLDFPFSGGLRAYVGHRFCGCWAWELGYTGLWGANASTTAEGDLTLPDDFGLNTNVFFGADRITLDYTSDIHSPEFNLVCCCCCCCEPSCGDKCGQQKCCSIEWIYGLRYWRIDENLDINAEREEEGGTETGSYSVDTSNDLYGGQFGIRLRRCRGPWSVEGTAKFGLYYNDAHQTQTITDFPDFVLRQSGADDDNVAFVTDLNASLIRQISDHWYVRGGYNLIWIDGVALAPSQLDFTQTSTSGADIDSHDTLFLHGFNFGFEGRW